MIKEATIYSTILETANKYPSRDALLYKNKHITYKEFLESVNKVAYKLIKLGFKKDDIITVALPNFPMAVYLLYAINEIGAINNLIHPLMHAPQLEEIMKKSKSKILFCLDTSYGEFEYFKNNGIIVVPVNPVYGLSPILKIGYRFLNRKKLNYFVPKEYKEKEFFKKVPGNFSNLDFDTDYKKDAIFLYSGGTTGESKAIALSSFSLNALDYYGMEILNIKEGKGEHMLSVLPMFHGFGLCMGIHAMLMHGGCDSLMPKFHTEETIKLIKGNNLSVLVGVPTLYEALLRNKDFSGPKLKNLRVAFVGGDFVSSSLIERFNQRMEENQSGCRLFEGYGLTETVTVCAVNTFRFNKEDSVGKLLPNVKCKIIDDNGKDVGTNKVGEIYLSGETLMNGYRFTTTEDNSFFQDKNGDFWIKTGDLGMLDEDRFLYYKQRLKRVIKVSGINIFPSEIENVVSGLKEVFEVAAIGVADVQHGQMVKLFVVLDHNIKEKNIDELIKQKIKETCGVYALPKEIVYLEKMPKTLVGKIDVKTLK